MGQKLVLLDSYSLANRAFFALPPLTTAGGQPTNAVYGLTMMLLRLIEDTKPDYLVAAFDSSAPTFRHQAYQDYKGQRMKMEDSFKSQWPLIRQLLSILRIPIFELPGYEADDLIGSLAKQAAGRGLEVEIVTGDRDAFQLVEPRIRVLYTRKGITELDLVDTEYLLQRYQLSPDQLIDFKGLTGDPSDNIPGVPGFGEKTALKYLAQFHSLEGIYQNLAAIPKERDRRLLETYQEQALLSKHLVRIVIDLPLQLDLEVCCRHQEYDREALISFCREYQFNSLVKKLAGSEVLEADKQLQELDYQSASLIREDLNQIIAKVREAKACYLQFLTAQASWNGSQCLGLGLACADFSWLYPFGPGQALPSELKDILQDEQIAKTGHDLKRQMVIAASLGIQIKGVLEDTLIAAYLLNAGVGSLELEDLTLSYLQKTLPSWTNDRGTKFSSFNLPASLPQEVLAKLAGARLKALQLLEVHFKQELSATALNQLYDEVELPLTKVLFRMEQAGIKVDPEILRAFGGLLRQRQHELETEIFGLVNEEFNISSPKQLGVILFERLGLKPPKKTKTGYSTDAEVLESLVEEHPVIPKLLEYRQNLKLQTTYIDSLIALINPQTGRVHTTYNQAVTTTGRLSSTEPNLQNIPVRSREGQQIRRAFIAKDQEHLLLAADYSQIELRVMAHFSQDPAFMEAFLKGDDIHKFTAAAVYGTPLAEVTREMRDKAKAVNFGIIYGISGFGLARNLKITRKEAETFIEAYFAKYPGVKSYADQLITTAHDQGEARTLLGRLRKLPDLTSRNFTLRSFAERMARNTPIQGTAADIIKLAMVKIDQRLRENNDLGQLLLQVHDELLFETTGSQWQGLARMVKIEMEGAIQLAVPLEVDLKLGPNWGELSPVTLEVD